MGGDEKKRQRNIVDESLSRPKDLLSGLRGEMQPQSQDFYNRLSTSSDRAQGEHADIMGRYGEFADTGGYSAQDLGNIRSRAISPIRSAYSSAQRGISRQRSLQGGYSPGSSVLQARMAREQGSAMSQGVGDAEANIAYMVQQGKLAGIRGMGQQFGARSGAVDQYGGLYGSAMDRRMRGIGLEAQLAGQRIGGHQNAANLPGRWEGTVGRAGQIAGIAGNIMYPWMQNSTTDPYTVGSSSMRVGGHRDISG